MAKNDDLFTTLRQRGLRKSVAQAISDAHRGGRRKRNAAKRSAAAQKGAVTRARRAKAGSR
jgi:transcription elongation GreA/GreB family factor